MSQEKHFSHKHPAHITEMGCKNIVFPKKMRSVRKKDSKDGKTTSYTRRRCRVTSVLQLTENKITATKALL